MENSCLWQVGRSRRLYYYGPGQLTSGETGRQFPQHGGIPLVVSQAFPWKECLRRSLFAALETPRESPHTVVLFLLAMSSNCIAFSTHRVTCMSSMHGAIIGVPPLRSLPIIHSSPAYCMFLAAGIRDSFFLACGFVSSSFTLRKPSWHVQHIPKQASMPSVFPRDLDPPC